MGVANPALRVIYRELGNPNFLCKFFTNQQIVNDWRTEAVGGMESALMLWEACCIPSLFHGSGSWMEIPSQTVHKLNFLQRWFVRLVLRVGLGTPVASLLWDFGLLDMRLRVWIEKLMFVSHKKIEYVRDTFRARYMLSPFAGNFSQDRLFAQTNWLCWCW